MRLRELCDRWLAAKRDDVKIGRLREATWKDYQRHCRLLAGRQDEAGRWKEGLLGDVVVDCLAEDDFVTLYRRFAGGSLHTLSDKLRMTRMILDWGAKRGYIQNPKYYQAFDPPSKQEMRNGKREKLCTAEQIRAMLGRVKLSDPLRAMIFLGINCGLGNTDCAHLRYDHLDLNKGILHYPRRKTGINRWCPLWPETAKALKDWLGIRCAQNNRPPFTIRRAVCV
jgi:integrase